MKCPAPETFEQVSNLLFARHGGVGWDLLTWLAEVRYATVDLVALRHYPSPHGVKGAHRRLTQLGQWQVNGTPLIASRSVRAGRRVYYLTESGAQLVSDHLQRPAREFWHDAVGRVADGIVHHYLAVTEFEVALLWHAARTGGQVLTWHREPVIETAAGVLRPDAAFSYNQGGQTWHVALEVDRNTESPAMFGAKVPRYAVLHQAPYRLYWDDVPDCLVVAVAGGLPRAMRLLEEVKALPRGPNEYRRFKYVAAEALYHIPPSTHGQLPEVLTGLSDANCLAVKGGEVVRRAVFG